LYMINSGPNTGNYLGIVHNNGTYADFDPTGQRSLKNSNYNWEAKYVVGSERAPDQAFSGDLGPVAQSDKGFYLTGYNDNYSEKLGQVAWRNLTNLWAEGKLGRWDSETGEFVNNIDPYSTEAIY